MSILLSLLLIAGQQQPSSAVAAADKFALDLPVDDAVTAPAEPTPAPTPAVVLPAAAGATTGFSLDTPIATLIADRRAKAVLDRNLPGLSSDENLSRFEALSLRKLAPLSGGQLTGALLTKVAYDLAALEGGAPPPKAKPSGRSLPSGR